MTAFRRVCFSHELVVDDDLVSRTGFVLQSENLFSGIRRSQDDVSGVDKYVGRNFIGCAAEVLERAVALVTQQWTGLRLRVKFAARQAHDGAELIHFRRQPLVVEFFAFEIDRPAEVSIVADACFSIERAVLIEVNAALRRTRELK